MIERASRLSPFSLGFVLVCLLQAGMDEVDPTAGPVERVLDLLLLAFAVSGVVAGLVRGPEPVQPGSALSGFLLRSVLVVASAVLAVLLLSGARVNRLGDLAFVVALLLVALTTVPYRHDRTSRPDVLLARCAVPAGLLVLAVDVPVLVARLADLR